MVTWEEAVLSIFLWYFSAIHSHSIHTHIPSAVPVHPLALTFLPSSHVAFLTHPGLVVRRGWAVITKCGEKRGREKNKDLLWMFSWWKWKIIEDSASDRRGFNATLHVEQEVGGGDQRQWWSVWSNGSCTSGRSVGCSAGFIHTLSVVFEWVYMLNRCHIIYL